MWDEFLQNNFIPKDSVDLTEEYKLKCIYPNKEDVFRAFRLCPYNKTRVVILGQDPYNHEKYANGLAFSVNKDITLPQHLVGIYQELQDDMGIAIPKHGDLSHWAGQGVLLLNAALTVEFMKPGSHLNKFGWNRFIDRLICELSRDRLNMVWVLIGDVAHTKAQYIYGPQLIIKVPGPTKAEFRGCKMFSRVNDSLLSHGYEPIDWRIE